MDENGIKTAIKKKFGTLRACAEALGISENNLNNKIKTRSDKFILELKRLGVDLPDKIEVKYEDIIHGLQEEINNLKLMVYDLTVKYETLKKEKGKNDEG